jgi:hypothetical protein
MPLSPGWLSSATRRWAADCDVSVACCATGAGGSGDGIVDRRLFLLTSLAVFLAWRTLNFPRTFKNQGDSVSFVNTAM